MATSIRSSRGDRTGAKQSWLLQSCGSRLPKTTIWYLAQSGLLFVSFFIFDKAMGGKVLPMIFQRSWYYFQIYIPKSWYPCVSPCALQGMIGHRVLCRRMRVCSVHGVLVHEVR